MSMKSMLSYSHEAWEISSLDENLCVTDTEIWVFTSMALSSGSLKTRKSRLTVHLKMKVACSSGLRFGVTTVTQ